MTEREVEFYNLVEILIILMSSTPLINEGNGFESRSTLNRQDLFKPRSLKIKQILILYVTII